MIDRLRGYAGLERGTAVGGIGCRPVARLTEAGGVGTSNELPTGTSPWLVTAGKL